MKTVFYLGSLVGVSLASLESLQANVEKLAKSRGMESNLRVGASPRAFQGFIKEMFASINGYGCWCYLDAGWRNGEQQQVNRASIQAHGMAVDPIDESCRDLINSYKCIEMDAEAQGDYTCDSQAVEYIPFNFFSANTDVEDECTLQNSPNMCAVNACIVEGAFTMKYINYLFDGIPSHPDFSSEYLHVSNNGTFDPAVSCPGIPNPVGSDRECCGDYASLTRHPYRLYTGFTTRSCCGVEVINNEIQQCCNNSPLDINELC